MNRTTTLRPIRICLAVLPDLARDILRDTFAGHRDMQVVEIGDGDIPPRTVEDECDVVVAMARWRGAAAGASLQSILSDSKRSKLVVTLDGARIMVCEYRPRQQLINPSPQALVVAIREGVARLQPTEE